MLVLLNEEHCMEGCGCLSEWHWGEIKSSQVWFSTVLLKFSSLKSLVLIFIMDYFCYFFFIVPLCRLSVLANMQSLTVGEGEKEREEWAQFCIWQFLGRCCEEKKRLAQGRPPHSTALDGCGLSCGIACKMQYCTYHILVWHPMLW